MENQNAINMENCGIYTGAGGNVLAKNIKITINPSTPGTSTAYHQTPFRFNIPTPTRHFKGRRDTMEAVRNYFITLPPQTVDCWERIVAIVGLGGMGKTETAYKFAAEFKEAFPNVAWIHAETESGTLASFMGLAKHLKIVTNDRKEADLDLVREVYHHLDKEDYGSTLFVFDNAIRLSSDEEEFGIMEYLPTDDLPNQRFPYVLITTQTHDWERRVETVQVDELTEEESLEFFRSCFQIQSAECDELFKNLHELLEGYPLVMNLAASQIDFKPKKDSVYQLKQQIQKYIQQLEKKQEKILSEKMNRMWPTKYNKTLSNVWQLTFERIQQEDNGCDALELLQFMSFLHVPIKSHQVAQILFRSSDCPHPPQKELEFRLKELIRVLERFYTVRILEEGENFLTGGYLCQLGIHRLVQFVARQQMDSGNVLERVLFYCAGDNQSNEYVHKSALEDALQRIQLSQWALPYVGILACLGLPAASDIVKTKQPETKAATTIWKLYNLERGMTTLTENATQVVHELIALTKSEERLADRNFFCDITMFLLTGYEYKDLTFGRFIEPKRGDLNKALGYFDLDKLDGIEEPVAQLILNVCSVKDLSCKSLYCEPVQRIRDSLVSCLTAKLSKTFIQADAPNLTMTVDTIADTWFAVFARLKYYDPSGQLGLPEFLCLFWRETSRVLNSPNAPQYSNGALKTCLWNRGLAKELIQQFEIMSQSPEISTTLWILQSIEFFMDGMDLRDERVQEVTSSIGQMAIKIEYQFISKDFSEASVYSGAFVRQLCLFWVKLFLMDDDPPSHKFLESLSQLNFMHWMEKVPIFYLRFDFLDGDYEFRKEYFRQFIRRFSSSDIKSIKTLVEASRRLVEEDNKVIASDLSRYLHSLRRSSCRLGGPSSFNSSP